ncbi:hypothetical protein HMPREF3034_01309 [Prevotella sp. DNF00663]|nr:hypothetical protein HMPREF3034_01309 [Prevotella sp. DNF00663]
MAVRAMHHKEAIQETIIQQDVHNAPVSIHNVLTAASVVA